jgi:hypothetical protein
MNFSDALRLTEIALGIAFTLQSLEHIKSFANEQRIFIPRLLLSLLLIFGFQSQWIVVLLLIMGVAALQRFQGPYNGGADRMSLLILCCLCAAHFAPTAYWQEMALGYLALQLMLSYVISGWVKLINPEWRSGAALCKVFHYSAYPVSESLREWSQSRRILFYMSWAVIVFEMLFPLALLSATSLYIALIIAAAFHFSNACLFGLNRFFWIWLAAYPSIIWLQQRLLIGF